MNERVRHESARAVVAIDVGGTTLKGALVGADGEPLGRLDAETPRAGGAAVTAAVIALARRLADGPTHVVGAAAVTPGTVDTDTGVVRYATNLGWRDVPLRDELTRALGVPAAIDHDARAAGLAESACGRRDCYFVAIGTGIGAALISGGVARAGAAGMAGELGHIVVRPAGERCACGRRGCLETYASAASIGRRYAAAGGPAGATARDVASARDLDPTAVAVWNDAVTALADALATVTLVLDPGTIVLGGGLAEAGRTLVDPLNEALNEALPWRAAPPIELSTLGADAGWHGAAIRAWAAADNGSTGVAR